MRLWSSKATLYLSEGRDNKARYSEKVVFNRHLNLETHFRELIKDEETSKRWELDLEFSCVVFLA